jgi:plasmid stabilization system protein ParE
VTVVWRAAAIADISHIIQYIAQDNEQAARNIGRALFLAGDALTAFPNRGRIGLDPTTRELVTVRPYIIVYEVDAAGNVDILRVWHAAQQRDQ